MADKRIAVVTGANKGIGFESVRHLSRVGVKVILTARDEARGEKASEVLMREGMDVLFHQLDVTDGKSIKNLHEYVLKEHGKLDILVNNAGVFLDRDESGSEVNPDTVRKTMETNVYGPLVLCQTFIPLMKKNGYGRIVNVSSGMGQLSDMGAGYLAYRLSKTALNAVTRVIAEEVRGSNILVNSMSPGWTRTDMGGPNATRGPELGADTIAWLATLPDGGPTGGFFMDRKSITW